MMLILASILIIILVILYVKRRHNYWGRRDLFQIKPHFLYGNCKRELTGKISFFQGNFELYHQLKALKQKHAGMYLFFEPIYIPTDLTIVKQILLKDFSHFVNHGVFHHPKDILTMNLFSIEDESWKQLRTKLTPTFSSSKIKMMFNILSANVKVLDRVIGEHVTNKKPIHIKDISARLTTDNIASCAFGIECNSLEEPDNIFRKYGKKIFEPQPLKVFIIETIPSWLICPLGFKATHPDVEYFFSSTVKNTIRLREETECFRNDFMQLLLEMKKDNTLTVDEITAQCFIFFVGGFETSSSTITFALLELSQHQDIQNKTKQEIFNVLKESDGELTYESLGKMKYLDMVINETLRMYPPLPLLPRVCTKRYQVPGTEVVIEKGTRVHIPVWGIHKDPDYYPNPEKFNPENFSEENVAGRPDMTFLAFGEGPRMCIGIRFGLLQTKLALACLLKRYRFTLNKKSQGPVEFRKDAMVLVPKDDIWLDATED